MGRCLLAVSALGLLGALKFLLSNYLPCTFLIRPKGFAFPLEVRGRSSDRMVLYSIFVEAQYPATQDDTFSCIIDAGANVGYAAIYFARHYPNARIIALEPEAGNYRRLERNTRFYPNIQCLRGALWKNLGSVSLKNPASDSWAFQVAEAANGDCIPCHTVDSLMVANGWKAIDLLKIDIEGAERDVFSSGTSWLKNTRRLYIEVHDGQCPGSAQAVLDALHQFIYALKANGDCLLIDIQAGRRSPPDAGFEGESRSTLSALEK
jgi:FkbM family methyltransferase